MLWAGPAFKFHSPSRVRHPELFEVAMFGFVRSDLGFQWAPIGFGSSQGFVDICVIVDCICYGQRTVTAVTIFNTVGKLKSLEMSCGVVNRLFSDMRSLFVGRRSSCSSAFVLSTIFILFLFLLASRPISASCWVWSSTRIVSPGFETPILPFRVCRT